MFFGASFRQHVQYLFTKLFLPFILWWFYTACRGSKPVNSCSRPSGSTISHFLFFWKKHKKHDRFRVGIGIIFGTFWHTFPSLFLLYFFDAFLDTFLSLCSRKADLNRSGKSILFDDISEPWFGLDLNIDFLCILDTFWIPTRILFNTFSMEFVSFCTPFGIVPWKLSYLIFCC